MFAYWIDATLAAWPALLWMFFGLGVPWSLVVLPRKGWADRVLVAALALALGPALLTAWMFILGTAGAPGEQPLLRFDLIFIGTVFLAAIGILLAWRKRHLTDMARHDPALPLAADEKLLIVLIVSAVIIRWFVTSFWTFTAYDPIWVYGYEGRLYTLHGFIPQQIGYYPQFLALQYTYAQLAAGGGIDDHAARAVIPFLHVGAVLAVYALAKRLFTRRAGIIAAGLWALYPHVALWARVGDLEIPQTFLLTLTATFFLMAWTGQEPRRRYALTAGLVYGIALWTKPTAAAFVWGVGLVLLVELARQRFSWRAWIPRLQVAFLTGLACLPLGGVWYIRNMLLGHRPVDLPPDFWLSQAQRSGAEFGWPLLALLLLLGYLYLGPFRPRPVLRTGLVGLNLVLLGLAPSIVSPHRMGWWEWGLLIAGVIVLSRLLADTMQGRWNDASRVVLGRIAWALALALPYFVTWFYSYSYHYRLSFAIVPLLLLPVALILARWLNPAAMTQVKRRLYLTAVVLIALPGVLVPLHDRVAGWDWLLTDEFPDDFARYAAENPSLMINVAALQDWVNEHSAQPVVIAPGAQLLPFFFPLADIRNQEAPDRLAQLQDATHYVYSRHAGWYYEEAGILPERNQIVSALGRDDILHRVAAHDDGNFFYETYEVETFKGPVDSRFLLPELSFILDDEVVFGDFARYVGANLHWNVLEGDKRILFEIVWQVLAPPPDDYMIYLHLVDPNDGTVWAAWDAPVAKHPHGYYSTLLWEPGEYILDARWLYLQDPKTPPGDHYRVIVGMYSLNDDQRVPITINGKPAGDGFDVMGRFTVK